MNNTLEYLKNNGIDVDLGLSFIGDETSYKELLLEFKNGFINQMNEIRTLYENKDIEKIQAVLEKNLDEKLMINEVKTKRLNKQGKRVLLIDADPQRRFNYLYGLL